MRMRLDLTVYYEANPENYESDNPNDMAVVDMENIYNDPAVLVEIIEDEVIDVHIRPAGPNG